MMLGILMSASYLHEVNEDRQDKAQICAYIETLSNSVKARSRFTTDNLNDINAVVGGVASMQIAKGRGMGENQRLIRLFIEYQKSAIARQEYIKANPLPEFPEDKCG